MHTAGAARIDGGPCGVRPRFGAAVVRPARRAGDPDGCRARRRGVLRACPVRDAVRPEPERHLPLARRTRRYCRLPGGDFRAGRRGGGTGPVTAVPDRHVAVFRCAAAWVRGEVRRDVDIACAAGTIVAVVPAGAAVDGFAAVSVEQLPGLVVPGFADAHSHVFHRALRGRTHDGTGTFWTWRERMYELAGRLDPDGLRELAFAGFLELLCAGYTAVGEFHYLHHPPGGGRYQDPNAMGLALAAAAADSGIA